MSHIELQEFGYRQVATHPVYLVELEPEQSYSLAHSTKAEAMPHIRYISTVLFISKLPLTFPYLFIREPISLAIKA